MIETIKKSSSTKAPEFEGIDTENRTQKLSAFKGKSNVVLVLNRGFA
jgi:peroxiredoxin